MAHYIVTATRLNRRRSVPSSFPEPSGVIDAVSKNFIFEGEEVAFVPNPALGKWFKDTNGIFYWGAGLAEIITTPVQPVSDVPAQPVTPAPSQPAIPAPAAVTTGTVFSLLQIKAATGSTTANAEKFMPFINDTCSRFKINTPIRGLCFLAQVGHESAGLFFTEELASGSEYEGRKDLGNTVPGDGVRFKGRGLIQITGRGNYKAIGDDLGIDFIASPAFLGGKNANVCTTEQLKNAALSAGWFWDKHNINALADKININMPVEEEPNFGDYSAITKVINGGTNGLADRVARYKAGVAAFR